MFTFYFLPFISSLVSRTSKLGFVWLFIRWDTGDTVAQNQGVNVVSTFIGRNRFKVRHMPKHRIVGQDTISPKDVPRHSCDFESHANVIPFSHRNVLKAALSPIFQLTQLKSQELAFGDLCQHPDQFVLHQLMRGDRSFGKLLTLQGPLQ